MKNKSYFSFDENINPVVFIDQLFNPFSHSETSTLNQHEFKLLWTRRAEYMITRLKHALAVEMQLYFSCMVKKRVIFSDKITTEYSMVTDKLGVKFCCVQASSCDPEEFAAHYPEKQTLDTQAALKIHPKELRIDYKNGKWVGEFTL